jgi:hypothetical protein
MQTFREILAMELAKRIKTADLASRALVTGKLTFEVFGPDGRLKQKSVMCNMVVDQGDALIADCLAMTPARTKLDNTHAWIEVGTGYAATTKGITAVVTVTGVPRIMDATYPKLKGAWAAAYDNVITYKATFTAGLLNVTGINEAALVNSATHSVGDCMAYAQVTPTVNVGLLDTLAVTWEITILGA